MTDSDAYDHDECSYLNRRRAPLDKDSQGVHRAQPVGALNEVRGAEELNVLRERVSTLEWAILRWSRDHPGLLTTDGEEILGREASRIKAGRKA